jgi:regulator of sigma E protease
MFLIATGIILFILLIVLHEYGHFLVAKRNGVDVEEFGIGFPPKIWGKKLGKGIFEGYYTINLLPLGGFVKLKGESGDDLDKGSFKIASGKAKLKIMLAGVAMNLVAAFVILTIVALFGMPKLINNQFTVASDSKVSKSESLINYIDVGSPAQKSGLKISDNLKSLNGTKINSQDELRQLTKANAGKSVDITYIRAGKTFSTKAQLLSTQQVSESQNTNNPKGYLGVETTDYTLVKSTWSAPIVAIGLSLQIIKLTIVGLGSTLAHLGSSIGLFVIGHGTQAKSQASQASQNVTGPIGVYALLSRGSVLGYQFILFIVGLLSLTLAIMNALPIPALDGGRAFLLVLFRLIKKPLLPKTEDKIHGTGFAILMILFVVIAIVDIKRFY